MFDYSLALMTGVDIPIPDLQIVLHQPTIKEISMIGEKSFFMGIQMLCINKSMISIEDESVLQNTSNFQIFMTMINEKECADKKEDVLQVLRLLFPRYQIIFTPRAMMFRENEFSIMVDENNFEVLQELLPKIFCLQSSGQQAYNPSNKRAKEIAEKLMRGRARVAAQQATGGSLFGQYLSIITIGINSMSLQNAMELTMFQIYDLMERFHLYINWDLDIKSRLAGGKPDQKVDNWMKKIH